MPLTSKDTLGIALAACTLGLLVLHGRTAHHSAQPEAVELRSPQRASLPKLPAPVVAFVSVQLPRGYDASSDQHVVVVRHGVVAEVGAAGSIRLPSEAVVVDGAGSAFLVAVPTSASEEAWKPVTTGVADDLVLYGGDPRKGLFPSAIRGRLVDGQWTPATRSGRSLAVPAGH